MYHKLFFYNWNYYGGEGKEQFLPSIFCSPLKNVFQRQIEMTINSVFQHLKSLRWNFVFLAHSLFFLFHYHPGGVRKERIGQSNSNSKSCSELNVFNPGVVKRKKRNWPTPHFRKITFWTHPLYAMRIEGVTWIGSGQVAWTSEAVRPKQVSNWNSIPIYSRVKSQPKVLHLTRP